MLHLYTLHRAPTDQGTYILYPAPQLQGKRGNFQKKKNTAGFLSDVTLICLFVSRTLDRTATCFQLCLNHATWQPFRKNYGYTHTVSNA